MDTGALFASLCSSTLQQLKEVYVQWDSVGPSDGALHIMLHLPHWKKSIQLFMPEIEKLYFPNFLFGSPSVDIIFIKN